MLAKLKNGKLVYPKKTMTINGHLVFNPTDEMLRNLGWKPYLDIMPVTDESHYASRTGYVEKEDVIEAVYEVIEIPKYEEEEYVNNTKDLI